MHTGRAYHEFMLASARDRKVRRRFQRQALGLVPPQASILDFGGGTGIDAKVYAAQGHRVFVHEPAESMRNYLVCHCREEMAQGRVILGDLAAAAPIHLITANFAVLNLIADQATLFAQFGRRLLPGGFVLASLLNPFFLGDAKYSWWRANLGALVKRGTYFVPGKSGNVHRFAPKIVARAAQPNFRVARVIPRGAGLAIGRYMFMLFQKA
ncbi:MAG TPA: methyltransferase domain-containing protein [Rhizomicrobium sp.]